MTIVGPERVSSIDLIPTIGIYGTYAFTNQLAFEGSIDGIAGSIDSYKGHYVAANAMLKYWFGDAFAVAAGYRYVDGKVEHSGIALNEEFGFNYSGLVTTVSVGF